MTYLHLKKDRNSFYLLFFILLLFTTSSCGFKSKDPVDIYNKKFLQKYENVISKKRDKHKQIAAENNIFYGYKKNPDDDLESIKLREELNRKFLEKYNKQKEIDEITKDIEVSYLTDNHGMYTKKVSIKRPNITKYAYFDKDVYKNKKFNYIYYNTIQTNYDYMLILKNARNKNYLNMRSVDLNNTDKKMENKEGVISNIINKFKSLFNK